jgi:hypothetical protein
MVFSKLLAYVNHYRDNSSVEKLRSTVLNFYSAAEITDAKKKLINVFNQALYRQIALSEQSAVSHLHALRRKQKSRISSECLK